MKYFTMSECTRSGTAHSKGIDNTPNAEHMAHITEAIETLIDPLCEAWERHCLESKLGKPGICISSGYRGPELNKAVGGSPTSAHCHGYAFDLVPTNGKMMEFKRFCHDFLADKAFDQLISKGEDSKGMPLWMHVGYKHPSGEQRHQCISMIGGKHFPFRDINSDR